MTRVQRQIDRLLAHRAAEWVEILKTGTDHDRRDFDVWLRQSPLHVTHFLEIVALGHEVQGLDPAAGEDVRAILARLRPDTATPNRILEDLQARRTTVASRWNWWTASLAAAMLLALTALFSSSLFPSPQKIDTVVGEQRSLPLVDGSLITLNTSSEIRVAYSNTERSIDLKSGEAVFKVARDAARPFVVRTRLATIRAVGTQFNVYQRASDALVSVLEGKVQISDSAEGQTMALEAGEEARVFAGGTIKKLEHADVSKTLAWQQRRLSFDEATLEEVTQEFNRYNSHPQFHIEGVTAGAYHFGGIFDAYDLESFATVLTREPGLRIERRGNQIVIKAAN